MKTNTEVLNQYSQMFRLLQLPPIQSTDVVTFMEDGMNGLVFALNSEIYRQCQGMINQYTNTCNLHDKLVGQNAKLNADVMTLSTECDTMKTQLDLAKRMLVAKQTDISDKEQIIRMKEGCMAEMTQELDRLNQKLAKTKKTDRVKKVKEDYPVMPRVYPEWKTKINQLLRPSSIMYEDKVTFHYDNVLFGDMDKFYSRISAHISMLNSLLLNDKSKGALKGRLHQHWNTEGPKHNSITVILYREPQISDFKF